MPGTGIVAVTVDVARSIRPPTAATWARSAPAGPTAPLTGLVIDGADAGRFLTTVKQRLEEASFEADLGL